MKSNIFFKVLGKTTIEIDESASEIIPKLCEQNGKCFEFDSEGRNFNFYCSKKERRMFPRSFFIIISGGVCFEK